MKITIFKKISIFLTFLLINNSQSSPVPQDKVAQYYDSYYWHYQQPYHQVERDNLQNIVAYPTQHNNVNSGYNQNLISVTDDENKKIFGNFIESIFRPKTTTTTTRSPTTINLAENLVQRDCVEQCIERPPSQYDPVCGSNGETYYNDGRLYCANDCGVDVTIVRRGICT